MAAAVALTFAPDAAARIEADWQALARAGHSDSMLRLGYAPHLTLAVWPEAPETELAECLEAAAPLAPPRISIATLGIAPGEAATLWLGVVPTAPLLALHQAVLARVPAAPDPHYRAGAWIPHVTLATALPPMLLCAAQQLAARRHAPFAAAIAAIEAVRFPPIAPVARIALGARP